MHHTHLNGRPVRSVLIDSNTHVASLLLGGEVAEGELDSGEVLPVVKLLPRELGLPVFKGDPGRRQPCGGAGKQE